MAETLEQGFAVPFLEPDKIRLFTNPNGVICLEYEDNVYWKVSVRRALPHQNRDGYIFLYNYNDDEIGALEDMESLPRHAAEIIEKLLQKRYFTQEIKEVYEIDDAFSMLIFKVRTDRKKYMDFTVVRPKDSIYRSRAGGILLTDVDNNLYHISSRQVLSPKDLIRVERYC